MLGIVVPTIGRRTETYIASHIQSLEPGATAVCSLFPLEEPQWDVDHRVYHLYERRSILERITRRLSKCHDHFGIGRLDLARVAGWLRRNEIDVVLCEYLSVAVALCEVCRMLRIPLVGHAHGYDITALPQQPRWAHRYREHLPHLTRIIAVSHDMKRKLIRHGAVPDRVSVIPCGVDVTYLERRCHTEPHGFNVVSVGRLVPKKGPIFLVEAFRLVKAAEPRATLDIIGDGPLAEAVRQFVRATNMEDSVRVWGGLPHQDTTRLVASAAVLLHHAMRAEDGDEEGLPVALLEAMAMGIPVVSTRHAGIPEVVKDGETGFLVEPGDCKGMAARTVALLSTGPLRRQIGEAAGALVREQYALDATLSSLRQVLASVRGTN